MYWFRIFSSLTFPRSISFDLFISITKLIKIVELIGWIHSFSLDQRSVSYPYIFWHNAVLCKLLQWKYNRFFFFIAIIRRMSCLKTIDACIIFPQTFYKFGIRYPISLLSVVFLWFGFSSKPLDSVWFVSIDPFSLARIWVLIISSLFWTQLPRTVGMWWHSNFLVLFVDILRPISNSAIYFVWWFRY